MAPKQHDRQYEVIVLGATGYTGALTAEHIARHLPTNLRWAIAGRSKGKLEDLAARLQKLEPDRVQPGMYAMVLAVGCRNRRCGKLADLEPEIEVVSFDRQDDVGAVVRKATVCISVVTYCHVGDQVVQACVENGTDYLDT